MRIGPQLIAARTDVPGFCNQLDPGQHRVLPDCIEKAALRVKALRLAAQDTGQIKAEAVDVKGLDPVAQAVHNHAQHHRVGQVERVAGAGIVHIGPPPLGQTVIAAVVQPAKTQGRPQRVAFARMVVDHVQDHLDPGGMKAVDHALHLADAAPPQIARFGGEKADGLIAPVIAQPARHQKAVIDKGLHGQQFNGGDPQPDQMLQHRIGAQPQHGAAQRGGHARMQGGQALDMRLVNHRVGQRGLGCRIFAPLKGRVDHNRFRHGKGAVAGVEGQVCARAAHLVAHQGIRPAQPPLQRAGIGIDQQLVGVEAVPGLGLIGAMGAKAIKRARHQARHALMPDVAVALAERQARGFLAPVGREQAQIDPFGMGRKDREIHAIPVETGPHGIGTARSHARSGRSGGQRGQRRLHPASPS